MIKWLINFEVLLVLLMAVVTPSPGQEAKLTASANPRVVGINDMLQVTFSLSGGKNEQFTPPDFKGFKVIGTSHTSGGGMTIIVNGKVVQGGNGGESWIYTLKPTATGNFTIGAGKAKVAGNWISSNSISVEVTTTTAKQNNKQNQQPQDQSGDNSVIYVKAIVNKKNVHLGEQVTLTYRIYTNVDISQYAINKLPSFTGFWSQEIMKRDDNPKQWSETVDGKKFLVGEIRKVALFPQKSGKLTIDPLEVDCIAQIVVKTQNNLFNDPFFNSFFNDPFFSDPFLNSVQSVKKSLKSESVTINVEPLPELNKPDDFSGAVGNFSLSADIDKTSVRANDAINLTFKISGTGNLTLIDRLTTEFPPDFEAYDPQITDNTTINGDIIGGSRTFSYLVIPRLPGNFRIKPVKFSYFDPVKNAYVVLESGEFNIKVAKGDGSTAVSGSQVQEDIRYIGNDIRFIRTRPFSLNAIGSVFFISPIYCLLAVLPVIFFLLFIIVWRRQLRFRSDPVLMKLRKAMKVARKRLRAAEVFMKNSDYSGFYLEVSRALWGYLSDKFAIPLSQLSINTVRENLSEKGTNEDVLNLLLETLDQCEFARFAPQEQLAPMSSVYNNAAQIISKMENSLK